MLENKISKVVKVEVDSFVKEIVPAIVKAMVDEMTTASQRVLKNAGISGAARRPGRPTKAEKVAGPTKARVAKLAKTATATPGEPKKRRKMSPEAKAKIVANLAKARAALAKRRKSDAKAAKVEAKVAEVAKKVTKTLKTPKNGQIETPTTAA